MEPTTLNRLTRLAVQRNARLESLREACIPLCRLIAPLRQPRENRYSVTEYRQESNVGGCSWLMVYGRDAEICDETWTIERSANETGGWTHGDFGSPKPCGPTPAQLRDFAAWLADPETLRGIADLEQETAEAVDGLTAKLHAAVEALR